MSDRRAGPKPLKDTVPAGERPARATVEPGLERMERPVERRVQLGARRALDAVRGPRAALRGERAVVGGCQSRVATTRANSPERGELVDAARDRIPFGDRQRADGGVKSFWKSMMTSARAI